MQYGHNTNGLEKMCHAAIYSSMQIDMNLQMLLIHLKCRQLCKTDKIKLS